MTDTAGTPHTEEPAPAPAPHGRRWWLVAGLVLVAVLAVGATAFAVSGDDDEPSATAGEQIATARRACQQWVDEGAGSGAGPAPETGWCDDMARGMAANMAGGQMMGPRMWDSGQAMRDWCVQSSSGRPAGDPEQWCDDMVGWMSRHMGEWGDHMHWEDDGQD